MIRTTSSNKPTAKHFWEVRLKSGHVSGTTAVAVYVDLEEEDGLVIELFWRRSAGVMTAADGDSRRAAPGGASIASYHVILKNTRGCD